MPNEAPQATAAVRAVCMGFDIRNVYWLRRGWPFLGCA
jgi:hypothetical protein